MPFDGVSLSLTDRLMGLGIKPIDMAIVRSHMAEQVAKHPGNWTYRYRHGIAATRMWLCGSCLLMMIVGVVLDAWGLRGAAAMIIGSSSLAILLMIFGLLIAPTAIGSKWFVRSYRLSRLRDEVSIPAPILDLLDEIQATTLSDLVVGYGELRQERILLDPFITVIDDDHDYAIGVWDGDTVLHIASKDD